MLFNSLSHHLNFKEAESSRFQVRKKTILQWKIKEKRKKRASKELMVDLELLWLVLFFNQHLQAQLIPIFLHVTQLFIPLYFPEFTHLYFTEMWSSGKLRKAALSTCPPKNLFVTTGKNQHTIIEKGVIQWQGMPALPESPSTNTSIS